MNYLITRYGPPRHSDKGPKRSLSERLAMGGFEYFENVIGLKLIGSGAWRTAICPLHSEKNPSFACNDAGAFKCFACDAKGASPIDFHRQYFGVDFKEAIADLTQNGVYDER